MNYLLIQIRISKRFKINLFFVIVIFPGAKFFGTYKKGVFYAIYINPISMRLKNKDIKKVPNRVNYRV